MRGLAIAVVLFAGLALKPAGDTIIRTGVLAANCTRISAVGTGKLSYVAVPRANTVAFRSPGRHAFARFDRRNLNGARTLFSIRQAVFDRSCRPSWFRVQLPIRPNGALGYIRAATVDVGAVHTRIVVDLSARRLTFFRRGHPRLRLPVSIGSPATQTPTGSFYVNQRIRTTDPTGPYGPSALGISAFSPVLTGWTQGGPIAVHGTNRPNLIGQAVSNGCIRIENGAMRRLFRLTPAGTPVEIRA